MNDTTDLYGSAPDALIQAKADAAGQFSASVTLARADAAAAAVDAIGRLETALSRLGDRLTPDYQQRLLTMPSVNNFTDTWYLTPHMSGKWAIDSITFWTMLGALGSWSFVLSGPAELPVPLSFQLAAGDIQTRQIWLPVDRDAITLTCSTVGGTGIPVALVRIARYG